MQYIKFGCGFDIEKIMKDTFINLELTEKRHEMSNKNYSLRQDFLNRVQRYCGHIVERVSYFILSRLFL